MDLVKAGDILLYTLFNIFLLRAIEILEKHIQGEKKCHNMTSYGLIEPAFNQFNCCFTTAAVVAEVGKKCLNSYFNCSTRNNIGLKKRSRRPTH